MDPTLVAPPRAHGSRPFGTVRPGVVAGFAYLLLTLTWLAIGDRLPGGRWLGIHLFTLGTLSNLILVFSHHFAQTLTRVPGSDTTIAVAALNAGVVLTLVGVTTGSTLAVVLGGTGVTLVVLHGYVRLRRMRKQALGARFGWIVRMYERAHSAFLHGAALGILLGTGVLTGIWYAPGRIAHLHVNVLGWGGSTLLATIVFFGPTMLRRRIQPGADEDAARALGHGATGLTVAVLALFAMGAAEPFGTVARLVAATGLAVYAWATTVVCRPVVTVARSSDVAAARVPVMAMCTWFTLAVWADVAVVAAGSWHYLDVLGAVLLAGVLLQAIVTALLYVAPMLVRSSRDGRDGLRHRLAIGALPRAVTFNLGVLLVATAAVGGTQLGPVGAVGWSLVALAVLQPAVMAAQLPGWLEPGTARGGRGGRWTTGPDAGEGAAYDAVQATDVADGRSERCD